MARRRRSRRKSSSSGVWGGPALVVVLIACVVAADPKAVAGFVVILLVLAGVWWYLRRRPRGSARLRAASLDEMLSLSPYEFEEATAALFRKLGYRSVKLVGGSGDYAADVLAVAPNGQKTVIQCKRYQPGNKVGSPVVQSFLGMVTVHHKAPRGILITTSSFTANARQIETKSNGILELIDGPALSRMLARASGLPDPATAQPVMIETGLSDATAAPTSLDL